jgi:hypothetical protein
MGRARVKRDAAKVVRDCIATRLRMVNRVITKVYDDALRPCGLRVSQMAMLGWRRTVDSSASPKSARSCSWMIRP